jgi:hypothetical protein
MRHERWVQHNLIRDEGRLPALREQVPANKQFSWVGRGHLGSRPQSTKRCRLSALPRQDGRDRRLGYHDYKK